MCVTDKRKWCDSDEVEDSAHSQPYKCRFCTKSFNKSQALGGHMNSHRQEREEEQFHQAKKLIFDKGQGAFGGSLTPAFPSPVSAKSLPAWNPGMMLSSSSSPLSESAIYQSSAYQSPSLYWNDDCVPSQNVPQLITHNLKDCISELVPSSETSWNPSNEISRNSNFNGTWGYDSIFGSMKNLVGQVPCHSNMNLLNNGTINSSMTTRFNTPFQIPTNAAATSYSGASLVDAEENGFPEQCNQASQHFGYGSDLNLVFSSAPMDYEFEWLKNKAVLGYASMQNDDAGASVSASSLPHLESQPYASACTIDMIDVGKGTTPYDVAAGGIDADLTSITQRLVVNTMESSVP